MLKASKLFLFLKMYLPDSIGRKNILSISIVMNYYREIYNKCDLILLFLLGIMYCNNIIHIH